jgi:quercetin dioxygenase-like cupin family protein
MRGHLVFPPGHPGHFKKTFEAGTTSVRLITPKRDGARVMVTRFEAASGFGTDGIVYTCDETVTVLSGNVYIAIEANPTLGTEAADYAGLTAGSVIHIAAGTEYSIRVNADSVLHCVFSAGPNGELPNE